MEVGPSVPWRSIRLELVQWRSLFTLLSYVSATKSGEFEAKAKDGIEVFLRFIYEYRRFLRDFARIAGPLSSLAKKKVQFM